MKSVARVLGALCLAIVAVYKTSAADPGAPDCLPGADCKQPRELEAQPVADPGSVSEKILPPGDYRDLVVRTCAVCHPADLVVAQRRSETEWDDIIVRMVERGAVATDDEQLKILDYFVKHFGKAD